MEWRASMPRFSHTKGRSFKCDTFAGKGSPVFCYYLFIPFPPTWQGVTILPFIDCSPSKSLPTPGWDLLLMWSLQFNLSMRAYKKDIKTFSTRPMHWAQQREIPSSDHMKFTILAACSTSLNMLQLKCFSHKMLERAPYKMQQSCLHTVDDDDMM